MRIGKQDHDEHERLVGYEHVATHVRRLRQRARSNRMQESLLFLPVLLLVGAVMVEQVLAALDRAAELPASPLDLHPNAAVALLSTIAGATITTAGVVFSLLVVSLQLASGQFSPRVLRTFWRDRFGQLLVGLLLATFAFCVLALTQVDTAAPRAPTLTMVGALLLGFASIAAIVAYLNRITRQQYVGRIVERIADETLGLVCELPYGSHTPLATIWPRPEPAFAAQLARGVGEAVIVGVSRTMQQDIDFGLRQLYDMGLRALSPAVNDPTTAIEVILRVSSIMRRLVRADLPPQSVRDEVGRVLLTPWDLDHGEYIRHAYGQLRRYAGPHPEVLLALMRNLRMLRAACMVTGARERAIAALDHQVEAVLATAAAAGVGEEDLAALREAALPR